MTAAPMIVTVAHRRTLDTALGEQRANLVYDGYVDHLSRAHASLAILAPGVPVPEAVVENMDGLLLTGGGDVDPARFDADAHGQDIDLDRDAVEVELVRICRQRQIPVLGMCRGNQVLNVAMGGSLRRVEGHVQAEALSEPVHGVELVADCRLARAFGGRSLAVNSYHRWAVDRLAEGFAASGLADDGVVEAFEATDADWFAVGAQWHAELLDHPHVPAMFSAFVEAVKERAKR